MLTSKLADLLEMVDLKRSEIVPCLLGDPGIGKTQGIYEFARKHNRNVVEIIASQIMPSEVSGITMPDQETKSMQIFDHARLASLKDGDILFFDELLQAPQAVLSACLTLIQERRMMSGKMLPDIMIVAAANPLRSPTLIAESIRQRFMFVEMEWDKDAWCDYIKRTYEVSPRSTLMASISTSHSDADKWNRLTPRTATKLIAWGKTLSDEQIPLFKETIIKMFDNSRIANDIVLSIHPPKVESAEDNSELFSLAIKAFTRSVWNVFKKYDIEYKLVKDTNGTVPILKAIERRLSNDDIIERNLILSFINHIENKKRLSMSMSEFTNHLENICETIAENYKLPSNAIRDEWMIETASTY